MKSKNIPKGWKKVKLGNLIDNGYCNILNNEREPLSKMQRSKLKEGILYPYYGATGIIDFINQYKFDGFYLLVAEDGTVTSNGINPMLQLVKGKFWVSNHAHVLQCNTEWQTKMLYYMLKNIDVNPYITGAVQPKLSKNNLMLIELYFPPLPEQRAIAQVLSSLDDKIDLLRRQNKTLEAMAETLFRKWFIEDAKEDWEEVRLGDVVEKANTGLDAIRRAPIVEEDTGIKCLRIQDISQQKPFEKWGNTKVKDLDFEKARLKKGDIIMARTCSPGIIFFVRQNMNAVFNNGLARIRSNLNKIYPIFLYYLFKTDDFISHIYGISDGTSVQLNMKLGDLLSYKFKFPPKQLQDKYFPYFTDIYNKIYFNQQQIRTLENLRDTLLPKLMSGEVRVKY